MGPSENASANSSSKQICDSALHSFIKQSITVDIPSCLLASGHASFASLSACVCLLDCLGVLRPWSSSCNHPNVVVPLLCADVDCPLRVACFLSPRSASLPCLRILLVSKPRDSSSRVRTRGFFKLDCGGDVSTNRYSVLTFSMITSSGSFC